MDDRMDGWLETAAQRPRPGGYHEVFELRLGLEETKLFLEHLGLSCSCTKVEVFVDKEVREAAPDREGKRARWCNK